MNNPEGRGPTAQCPRCEAPVWHPAALEGKSRCPSCGFLFSTSRESYETTNIRCWKCGTRIFVRSISKGVSVCPTCGVLL